MPRFRFLAAIVLIGCAFAGCRKPAGKLAEAPETPPQPVSMPTPAATPAPTPPPEPTPPPPPYVPAKRLELGKIFNGIQYRVHFETERGGNASIEREDPGSYTAELTVKVKVPKPHRSLADLSKLNAQLPSVLPSLAGMLEHARVSSTFEDLYRRKCAQLQASINRLDVVLSRHNFFDCETILEMQHPQSKRRAILIQADMDTDTDGSDADRAPDANGAGSLTYQPMTSYSWPKKGTAVSPFIAPLEAKIKEYEQELALPATNGARKSFLRSEREDARTKVTGLKARSYLVAKLDPFIVLPTPMVTSQGAYAPLIGDYCVVIYGDTAYPAIVGDAGPTTKMGEASLRICKQIEPASSGLQRAENDLKVTYVVFPSSRERPFEVPDVEKWNARCEALLAEIGFGGKLHKWEDLLKPKAPPTTPAPSTAAPSVPVSSPSTPAPNGNKPTAAQ